MKSLQLRAQDRTTMLNALEQAGLASTDDDNNLVINSPNVADLGTLSKPTGQTITDPESGEPTPEYETCKGYHVNVLTDDKDVIESLAGVEIHPNEILVNWAT